MALKKELGFLDVFCIASGAMISSGIFILPSLAFSRSGPAVILAYLLGAIIAFFGILSVIELTTAMPKAGGDYFFIKRALGPLAGTISGMLSWFAGSLKTAFAIYGIGAVLAELFFCGNYSNIDVVLFSLAATSFFVVLNIVGAHLASKFEVIIVLTLMFLMLTFIIVGLPQIDFANFKPFIAEYANGALVENSTKPLFSLNGLSTIALTTGLIFVSFGGLFGITSISEEIRNPKRNIVWGLLTSILTTSFFYVAMIFVTIGLLKAETLSQSLTPIADAARIFGGEFAYYAIIIASILAFVSTANAGIMAASRYPFAMARDKLIPEVFSKINKKFNSPVMATLATGFFIGLAIILPLEYLVKTASAVILVTYILSNASVIVLRESKIKNYKPTFRTKSYPKLQIIMIIIFLNFVISFGFFPLLICCSLAGASLYLYRYYGSKKYVGDYALLYVLTRITDNIDNSKHKLESELRDIIHEREEIQLDHFDNLIKKSKFIELQGPANLEDLFAVEADFLSGELNIEKKDLINLFHKREDESSTAISEFTAIPHIVIKNNEKFQMVVVRCKDGINFNEENPSVKAVFLFVSGGNLAHEHLQILAAIASITQLTDFEKSWINATNENYLKDLILLAERQRF